MGGATGSKWPHKFFVVFVAAVLVGVIAGCTGPGKEEAYSLNSGFLHRCEVGVAIGLAVYIIAVAGWLAWHGRYLPQLQGPAGMGGGGESQPVDPGSPVDAAADDFNAYRKDVDARFKLLENASGNLVNRVAALEGEERIHRESGRLRRLTDKLRAR